ncbi:hypothetical protein WA026_019916 [Henosepilachna vigintioctopunctata]|uniref:Uncharacterized protein n=1 Tax=Henosepilachna vigintioctopunctata TaxID=420089 RepID=A0AAW1V3X8_9CUCU
MAESESDGGNDNNFSIKEEYDEIMQLTRTLQKRYSDMETSCIKFVENSSVLNDNFQECKKECLRLVKKLKMMSRENEELKKNLAMVKELFLRDENIYRLIPEDNLKKLELMDKVRTNDEEAPHLRCIQEVSSTGSISSNSKYEEEMTFAPRSIWKKHRPSTY